MIENILEAVASVTKIPSEEIKGNGRTRQVSEARGLFFLVSSMAGFSTLETAETIDKSLSSALQLARKTKHLCNKNKDLSILRDKVIEIVGKYLGEKGVDIEPFWNDNFYVLDVSSYHLGKCFIGMIDGNPVIQEGSFYGVANRMLDYKLYNHE